MRKAQLQFSKVTNIVETHDQLDDWSTNVIEALEYAEYDKAARLPGNK